MYFNNAFLHDTHRVINADNLQLQFALAEPSPDELLPVNDDDWEKGEVVPNEPLFTESFSTATTLGYFARTCQAAHILSRVIRHIKCKRSTGSTEDSLSEARYINNALAALQLSIEQQCSRTEAVTRSTSQTLALSVCICARFKLSREYACNEIQGGSKPNGHFAQSAELQSICLANIKLMAFSTVPQLILANSECPLTAHSLYLAAGISAWFTREDHKPEVFEALARLVQGLRRLSEKWAIGSTLTVTPNGTRNELIYQTYISDFLMRTTTLSYWESDASIESGSFAIVTSQCEWSLRKCHAYGRRTSEELADTLVCHT